MVTVDVTYDTTPHDGTPGQGATSRTRYYERATMLIKRAVLMLLLQPYLVGTTNMIADSCSRKRLEKGQFIKLRDVMMNHITHHYEMPSR